VDSVSSDVWIETLGAKDAMMYVECSGQIVEQTVQHIWFHSNLFPMDSPSHIFVAWKGNLDTKLKNHMYIDLDTKTEKVYFVWYAVNGLFYGFKVRDVFPSIMESSGNKKQDFTRGRRRQRTTNTWHMVGRTATAHKNAPKQTILCATPNN